MRKLLGWLSCTFSLWVGRSAVSPSSPVAAQKGNGDGKASGLDSARVELNWRVEKLLGWMDGAMRCCGGWSARARSRRPWRTAEGERRRGSRATAGLWGYL
jgi:hypothetical protein